MEWLRCLNKRGHVRAIVTTTRESTFAYHHTLITKLADYYYITNNTRMSKCREYILQVLQLPASNNT